MSQKWKRPGGARQRTTEAESCHMGLTWEEYTKRRDLQTRRLQQRHGLDAHTARLIASLCFGEGR
ncbi:hypothetical protein [Lutimaribacter saemankumensis]|uniref:Uncharacterized protein n=1 Tax=Lutimaribacter saemankumensis TaxID=490829 RepID=A0A1G8RDR8_9RHOB|nr:hypothetical protein [Lutimaribacter saemankumensis]SDJ15108.1 hypothetical protein SAMN05421850_10977 [Lutimaribacter saemankumensis]